jgi:tape measure domain-containing protein
VAENRTVKVTLKAEISGYVASMLRGAKATSDLGASAASAASDIERAMTQSENAAKSNEQTFTRWGTVTKRTFAAVALAASGFFAALLVQGVNANSFAEQNQVALTTMLGDAKSAKAALDQVYGLATETPFQFPVLTEQFKMFAASRMELDKIIPLMRAYTSSVAALGGDNEKLQLVAESLAKISTLGKAETEQLNNLALNGIPVWQMLADEAGKSVAEVRKDVENGLYDSERTIRVVTAGMQDAFGGMLDAMGDTYTRWQDRAASAQRRTAEQVAKPLMEVGKQVLKSVTAMFDQATASLKGVDWGPVLEPLGVFPAMIDDITDRLGSSGIQATVDAVAMGLELFSAAAELAYATAMPLVDVLGLAAQAGEPLINILSGLVSMYASLPEPIRAGIAALLLIRALNGPYTQMITAVTGWGAATRSAIAEQIRYQQVLQTGTFLNGQAAASTSRMSLVWGAATTSARGLGVAARGAGAAIMGAFGGPVGLAIAAALAGITIATTVWTDAQRSSEEAAYAQEAAIDSVTSALERNTGAFGENAREVVANQLVDAGLPEHLAEIGIGLDEFEAALYGGADAQTAFRQRLIELASTDDMAAFLERTGLSLDDVIEQMTALDGEKFGIKVAGLETLAPEAAAAVAALQILDGQVGTNSAALERLKDVAQLAGREADFNATPTVESAGAVAALNDIRKAASQALASFINTSPQRKKSSGGGGGGGGGEDPAVKAAKAEQQAIKKRTDAEKKAASEYEKLMQERARAAKESADEAEAAAREAASAEEAALEKSTRAVDAYVSAQRQRQAIERTLAAETDPVRRAQLQQALADATAHEAAMLLAKTSAEQAAAAATTQNTAAQARANETVTAAATAQTEYEAAAARAAAVQESAAVQIEAAAERLAAATESAAERSGSAMSGAADEVMESLDEWIARMWEQITAQSAWVDNMVWLAGNASAGVVSIFTEMGADGAYLLAELRRNGGAELAELEALAAARADGVKLELLTGIETVGQLYPAIVKRFGRQAADELVAQVTSGKVSTEQLMSTLKAEWNGQEWTLNIDAETASAMAAADSLSSYISSLRPSLTVTTMIGTGYASSAAANLARYPWAANVIGRAGGGEIDGPGPKGVDSVPVLAAPGEHMLTAADVDAMGGQRGVYAFRRSLHSSAPSADLSRAVSSSSGRAEPRVVINQKIYYPVREPASESALRAGRDVGV